MKTMQLVGVLVIILVIYIAALIWGVKSSKNDNNAKNNK